MKIPSPINTSISSTPATGSSDSIMDNQRSNNIQSSNVNAQQSPNNRIDVEKSRPSKKVAPLVDSTLLRFLSQQKNQLLQQTEIIPPLTLSYSIINSTDVASSVVMNKELKQREDTDNEIDNTTLQESINIPMNSVQTNSDSFTTSTDSKRGDDSIRSMYSAQSAKDTTADCLSWFTQFNSHRVAQKLVSLGACQETAMEAGSVVQNYCLNRTTRQRVRKFLRDRDIHWTNGEVSQQPSFEMSNVQEEALLRGDRKSVV
jgi:hypothetical protein